MNVPIYDQTEKRGHYEAVCRKAKQFPGVEVATITTHHMSRAKKPYKVRRWGLVDRKGVFAVPYIDTLCRVRLGFRGSFTFREMQPISDTVIRGRYGNV